MIEGRNINAVVQEILRQSEAKKDVIVPSQTLTMVEEPSGLGMVWTPKAYTENDIYVPSRLFHDQLGTHLNIPSKFYDRIQKDFPDLLAMNVNRLLHAREENRMVRTLDGQARAFLSDRYRRLDNDEVARRILPIISEGPFQIQSLEVTDTRFYMQVISPRTEGEVRKGDPVQAGFILSNSEVGQGALALKPLLYRLVCTNGMVLADQTQRHRHLGGKLAEGVLNMERLSDEAQAASDQALWLAVRDTVSFLVSQEGLDGMLAGLKEVADDPITSHPEKAVKVLSKVHGYRDDEENAILRNLLDSGDLTRWGLANAVTATANNHESYDRAVELEKRGGDIMALTGSAWSAIAAA